MSRSILLFNIIWYFCVIYSRKNCLDEQILGYISWWDNNFFLNSKTRHEKDHTSSYIKVQMVQQDHNNPRICSNSLAKGREDFVATISFLQKQYQTTEALSCIQRMLYSIITRIKCLSPLLSCIALFFLSFVCFFK